MLKQQTVTTSLGDLSVSSLTLGDLRQLDQLFQESNKETAEDQASNRPARISSLLRYMPIIHASARRLHQDMTLEQMENGLTLEDFNALFNAVLEVSGLKKADQPAGEPTPVAV